MAANYLSTDPMAGTPYQPNSASISNIQYGGGASPTTLQPGGVKASVPPGGFNSGSGIAPPGSLPGVPGNGGIAGQSGSGIGGAYSGNPSDTTAYLQWLATQPGHDPILDTPQGQQYYATQIAGSGGLNAQNLDYWKNKGTLAQYGGAVGAGGGSGGGGGFGDTWNTLPSLDQINNYPGLQFAEQQGQNAIQHSAAAHGTLLTGGTLKDLAAFGVGTALQGYGNLANLNLAYNQANANNLYNLSSLGATSSSVGATGRPV